MLGDLVKGRDLTFEEAYRLFIDMREKDPVNIAADLVALSCKGYTEEEIAGFAKAMRDSAPSVDLGETADTCGTGGDSASSINVSTAASIILSCFFPVAKHGNNSVTSNSGSSNVMDALGINTMACPDMLERGIGECQYAYLHAPQYHKSLERIMPVRRALGLRTIFNIVGPLCNPARPVYQMVGVSDMGVVKCVSEALRILKAKRALVVHSRGLDEVHPSKSTMVYEVNGRNLDSYVVTPQDFGLDKSRIIPCKGPINSAERIMAVLSGHGIVDDRNFIVLNASMALYATGIGDFQECRELIESVLGATAIERLEMIRNAYPKM